MFSFVGAIINFSTFSVDSANLIQIGQYIAGLVNIFGSNLLGIAYIFVGSLVSD
jgi:fluoride ion exporter CrcB/FEX